MEDSAPWDPKMSEVNSEILPAYSLGGDFWAVGTGRGNPGRGRAWELELRVWGKPRQWDLTE